MNKNTSYKDNLKLRYESFYGLVGKCPSCGSRIVFSQNAQKNRRYGSYIDVKVETRGEVFIPDLYIMSRVCENPLCKWSILTEEEDE